MMIIKDIKEINKRIQPNIGNLVISLDILKEILSEI